MRDMAYDVSRADWGEDAPITQHTYDLHYGRPLSDYNLEGRTSA